MLFYIFFVFSNCKKQSANRSIIISDNSIFNNNTKQAENLRIRISDDIELIKLSDRAYVHVSVSELPGFGVFSSNGLIFVVDNEAFLFDTPVTEFQTKVLVNWITYSLSANLTTFVAGHWHDDNLGGLNYLHSIGVKSYANQMTIKLAEANKMPVPQNGFIDFLELDLGSYKIHSYFFGGAHSADNIVTWIPSEEILFGGCMIRANNVTGLGNIADAVVDEWLPTIQQVIANFPNARIVIPGHGEIGGIELLEHTRRQLE